MAEQQPTDQQQHPRRVIGDGGGGLNPRELVFYYYKVRLHERVKQKLKGSGFELIFELDCKITHVKSLLLALIEAYDIETGAFHIGRNRLYFGLEDVLMITGLPIDGKPVIFESNTPNLTDQEASELVGVCCNGKFFDAMELVGFNNSFDGGNVDEGTLDRTARAAALLGIGCMISSNMGKSRVHMKFLNFLGDVGEINSYAWGAASWVNLHTSLKGCKSDKTHTSLFGCVFGLEIFFLTHIPKLVPVCFKNLDPMMVPASFPLIKPWVSAMAGAGFFDGKHRPSVEEIWKIFCELDPSEVVWQPYHNLVLDDPYLQQGELRRSCTTALFLDHAVHHLPQVAAQQFFDGELVLDEDSLLQLHDLPLDRKKASKDALKLSLESWNLRKEKLIRTRSEMQNVVAGGNPEIVVPPSRQFIPPSANNGLETLNTNIADYPKAHHSNTNIFDMLYIPSHDYYMLNTGDDALQGQSGNDGPIGDGNNVGMWGHSEEQACNDSGDHNEDRSGNDDP